jgi:hypothetical protein
MENVIFQPRRYGQNKGSPGRTAPRFVKRSVFFRPLPSPRQETGKASKSKDDTITIIGNFPGNRGQMTEERRQKNRFSLARSA